jgi:hypothetical protein
VAVAEHPFELFYGKRRMFRAINYVVSGNPSTDRNKLRVIPTALVACEVI